MIKRQLIGLATLTFSSLLIAENKIAPPKTLYKNLLPQNYSQPALKLTLNSSTLFEEPEVKVLQTFTGEQPGDAFGWVAENLGDINGDNVNDFIVTAPFYSTNLPFPAGKFLRLLRKRR